MTFYTRCPECQEGIKIEIEIQDIGGQARAECPHCHKEIHLSLGNNEGVSDACASFASRIMEFITHDPVINDVVKQMVACGYAPSLIIDIHRLEPPDEPQQTTDAETETQLTESDKALLRFLKVSLN